MARPALRAVAGALIGGWLAFAVAIDGNLPLWWAAVGAAAGLVVGLVAQERPEDP